MSDIRVPLPERWLTASMCATCHRPVEQTVDLNGGGVVYHHGGIVDHEVVIVRLDPAVVVPVCDFCDQLVERGAETEVRCEPRVLVMATGGPDYHDDGTWFACLDCAALIRAGRWDDLTNRALDAYDRQCISRGEPPLSVGDRGEYYAHLKVFHDHVRDDLIEVN